MCHVTFRQTESNANTFTEALASTIRHQAPSSRLNRVRQQDADEPHVIELSPLTESPAGQSTHNQHDDTEVAATDPLVVGAATEQRLCSDQSSNGNRMLHVSDSNTTPWRAHHQDFYASKWFRSLEIFIIVNIILVAFVIFVSISLLVGLDFDDYRGIVIWLPTFSVTFLTLLCLVIGGVFKSKVFR